MSIEIVGGTSSLRAGEQLRWQVVNLGTGGVSYGLDYAIEGWTGTEWVQTDIAPRGFPQIGFFLSGGTAGDCEETALPAGTPAGSYRLVRRVGVGRAKRDLAAPFRVTG